MAATEIINAKVKAHVLANAILELHEARDYFDQAEPEQIDEATYRLNAAEIKVNRVINELKKEWQPTQ